MDFIKKHKIAFILVTICIIAIVWYMRRTSADTVKNTATLPNSVVKDTLAAAVSNKTIEIMNNAEWYNQILAGYASQGYTLQQALTANAIWALKKDGSIPIDSYGAGEWGHIAYVKANF